MVSTSKLESGSTWPKKLISDFLIPGSFDFALLDETKDLKTYYFFGF